MTEMIRNMVRDHQVLSEDECIAVLERNNHGVLAVMGDEGYPYGVPLNYVFLNGKIYFHSAKEGYKVELFEDAPKVSFTVIDLDEIHPDEITSYFRSVIAMGSVRKLSGDEYMNALKGIAEKYMKGLSDEAKKAAVEDCGFGGAFLYGVDIAYLSGKQAEELIEE